MKSTKVRPELKHEPTAMCIDWVFSQDEATIIAQLKSRPRLWRAVLEWAPGDMQLLVDQARADMQEACAVVAEAWYSDPARITLPGPKEGAAWHTAREIAAAIRARGTDEPTQD